GAEVERSKEMQWQILDRLDNHIDTQLTGNNVEDGIPVKSTGSRVVEEVLLERQVRTGATQKIVSNVPADAKSFIIVLGVYGVTGNFAENEGYSLSIYRHTRGSSYAYVMTSMDRKTFF